MGFFDKINKIIRPTDKLEKDVEDISKNTKTTENIVLSSSSYMVEDEVYGEDNKYLISFKLNQAFKEAESHAGEIEMLYTYAPMSEDGEEGTYPYLAIQFDDEVYNAVEEFKEKGTFTGAIEITPLSEKFYFKAKMEYYECIMYFYAMDRCDGAWENNGLCIVYPKSYIRTENELKLMSMLDEAANSYCETKLNLE